MSETVKIVRVADVNENGGPQNESKLKLCTEVMEELSLRSPDLS